MVNTLFKELQSANEEPVPVNSELNSKVTELAKANTDQMNMLQRVDVCLIFLSQRLQVRRFNFAASELLDLVSSDIGYPITSLAATFEYDSFPDDCNHVLNTLESVSRDLRAIPGEWYRMEIHPYRTAEGDVDGLVVTFDNITIQ